MSKKIKKNKNIFIIILLIIVISIGYSYLTTNLPILSSVTLFQNTWDIHFENIKMINNSTSSSEPILTDYTTVNFSPNLDIPGDEYSFSINIVNNGSIDAMVSEVIKSTLTDSEEKFVDYVVTYIDDKEINKNDKIESGSILPIKVKVGYKKDLMVTDIPSTDQNLSFNLSIDFVQADRDAKPVVLSYDFAEDSWKEIVTKVRAGLGANYEVGATKKIDLGDLGVHTIRIANTSTPEECSIDGYSQTACGFVLEFADAITSNIMNEDNTNKGGWANSDAREYTNNIVYNLLPNDLKNAIINTFVVSGHGIVDNENNISTDKIYLLSTKEVYGKEGNDSDAHAIHNDTAEPQTHQLDYYRNIGVNTSNYEGAIKYIDNSVAQWWLRTAYSDSYAHFYNVSVYGYYGFNSAYFEFYISPAFRIG